MIKLYNTLTRKKDTFGPIKNKTVGLYTCGPTVYDYAHIGNLRSYIFEDVLHRVLEFNKYKVKQVMNITDIDDKTIKRSMDEKKPLEKITQKYTELFLADSKKLNIERASLYPKATDNIKEMIGLIQKLLDKKIAYLSQDGSVYFSIEKFNNYGKFAGLDLAGLRKGSRVSSDEYQKEKIGDFVLWKKWIPADGDNFWLAKFKNFEIKGRPGWHIECSAMSKKYLGQPFDIHAGAVDLIFPHHENEIAQSEAAYGKKLANYWTHGEHLLVDNKKMAKSAGNYYTLADIIKKGFDPLAFRYLCLETHYRSKLNFTWKSLEAAQNTFNSIRELAYRKIDEQRNKETEKQILTAFNDDLDTPKALALLHKSNDYNLWLKFEPILGLGLSSIVYHLSSDQDRLIKDREQARVAKDFARSDEIRNKLADQGIIIEDTKNGTRVVKTIDK